MKVIVYKQDNGQIALVVPSAECPLTVEEIARKDVPTGKPTPSSIGLRSRRIRFFSRLGR